MSTQWYWSRSGQQFGPSSWEQLKDMAAQGRLLRSDFLWNKDMPAWAAAATVPDLFPPDALDPPYESTRPQSAVPPPPPGAMADLDVERTAPRAAQPGATPVGGAASDLVSASGQAAMEAEIVDVVAGEKLGRYLVLKKLGEGGHGTVYKVLDQEHEEEYAVKVLPPHLLNDAQALSSLRKEVNLAKKLTHQNLLRVHDLETAGTFTFLTMELIDGESLEEYRLRKGSRLQPQDLVDILPQLLAGLDYLHDKGMVHLDIKPQNILIARNGELKLADYGIARTIREQVGQASAQPSVGTLVYMAPEQLRDGSILDRRTDIYAVGMLLHRLLCGDFPFPLQSRETITQWHLDERHPIKDTGSANLNTVIKRALSVQPAQRYGNCRELFDDLQQRGGLQQAVPQTQPAATTSPETEHLLELTRIILEQLQRSKWETCFDMNFPEVIQKSEGGYELPKAKGLAALKGMISTKVNPAEELAAGLARERSRNPVLDPRLSHNVKVVKDETDKQAGGMFSSTMYIVFCVVGGLFFFVSMGPMAIGDAGIFIGFLMMLASLGLLIWSMSHIRYRQYLDKLQARLTQSETVQVF